MKTYRKPNEQLFSQYVAPQLPKLNLRYENTHKKVQVGKDQEKAQSEKDSHSKNQGGKNQTNNQVLIP